MNQTENKMYRLYYMAGNRKHYACQVNEDFCDDAFTFEVNLAGKFSTNKSTRMVKESRLGLVKELGWLSTQDTRLFFPYFANPKIYQKALR